MISWIILSILYILSLIFVVRFDTSLTNKIFIFAIINFIFYKITNKRRNYHKSNPEELIEKLARILIYLSILLPIAYGSYYLIFIFNSNKNGKIFGISSLVISLIIIIYFFISFIKGIKDFAKERIALKREEKRKRMMIEQEEKIEKIINNFRELIKGLENDEAIALLEIEIPKLQEGETKEIYKKGLSKLYDAKHREEERLRREKEEEEERIRIEKEKEEERTRIKNEVKDNVENNRFVETNMPLIAEEGCFVMLDNIEYYEYRTKYGATNYEKVGEGKVYITNKRLYFITEINAFHLIWLEHIMDINWYENKNQLKITRDGNAIFLESYDEMDIYKMYYYIKTINGK